MEQYIPTYNQMAHYSSDDDPCLKSKLLALETTVLSLLDWSLGIVLPVDYVCYFLDEKILFGDDTIDGSMVDDHPDAINYIEKFAWFFVDIVSQSYEYLRLRPSVLGASIIVCARRALRIQPYCPDQLQHVLIADWKNVTECVTEIWRFVLSFWIKKKVNSHRVSYFITILLNVLFQLAFFSNLSHYK